VPRFPLLGRQDQISTWNPLHISQSAFPVNFTTYYVQQNSLYSYLQLCDRCVYGNSTMTLEHCLNFVKQLFPDGHLHGGVIPHTLQDEK